VIADRKRLRQEQKQEDLANGNTQKAKRRPAFLDLLLDMQEVGVQSGILSKKFSGKATADRCGHSRRSWCVKIK
jgi:hypothetical protein